MNAAAAGTSAVQVWTLVIAALAIVGTTVSAILLRRTGKGTVRAAEKAADASERSAAAAEKSAQAAQDAVGVSRETAAGVADRAEADALTTRYQEAAAQAAGPANPGLARRAVRTMWFSLRKSRWRMDMMMALRANARGGPEQLVYEPAPVPVPQPQSRGLSSPASRSLPSDMRCVRLRYLGSGGQVLGRRCTGMSAALRASAMAPRDGLDTTPTAGMRRAGSSGQRVLITHLRVVTRWQRFRRPRGRSRRGISAAGSIS
jgi:hypothetical protein